MNFFVWNERWSTWPWWSEVISNYILLTVVFLSVTAVLYWSTFAIMSAYYRTRLTYMKRLRAMQQ